MFKLRPAPVGVLQVHLLVSTVTFTKELTGALSANRGVTCTCPPTEFVDDVHLQIEFASSPAIRSGSSEFVSRSQYHRSD